MSKEACADRRRDKVILIIIINVQEADPELSFLQPPEMWTTSPLTPSHTMKKNNVPNRDIKGWRRESFPFHVGRVTASCSGTRCDPLLQQKYEIWHLWSAEGAGAPVTENRTQPHTSPTGRSIQMKWYYVFIHRLFPRGRVFQWWSKLIKSSILLNICVQANSWLSQKSPDVLKNVKYSCFVG